MSNTHHQNHYHCLVIFKNDVLDVYEVLVKIFQKQHFKIKDLYADKYNISGSNERYNNVLKWKNKKYLVVGCR